MSNYKPGTWLGRVTDYGISETQAGDPQVFVAFDVDIEGQSCPMTWFGSLKEGKPREITLKALLALGFQGKDVADLIDGPDGGAIDVGIDAKLVCEEDEWQGQKRVKIRWINSPQGGSGVQRADAGTAKAKLLKLGIAGDLAKLKATEPGLVRQPSEKMPF